MSCLQRLIAPLFHSLTCLAGSILTFISAEQDEQFSCVVARSTVGLSLCVTDSVAFTLLMKQAPHVLRGQHTFFSVFLNLFSFVFFSLQSTNKTGLLVAIHARENVL